MRCQRAYYLCRSCGHGSCPFDQAVGLPEANVTPAVERLTALAGAVSDSFEKGADLLAEMAGVRLCESTVQRTTEAVGKRIADALVAGRRFGPDHPWKFYHDALGRSIAYIEGDATGVRQQGPHGEQVDGRPRPAGSHAHFVNVLRLVGLHRAAQHAFDGGEPLRQGRAREFAGRG